MIDTPAFNRGRAAELCQRLGWYVALMEADAWYVRIAEGLRTWRWHEPAWLTTPGGMLALLGAFRPLDTPERTAFLRSLGVLTNQRALEAWHGGPAPGGLQGWEFEDVEIPLWLSPSIVFEAACRAVGV